MLGRRIGLGERILRINVEYWNTSYLAGAGQIELSAGQSFILEPYTARKGAGWHHASNRLNFSDPKIQKGPTAFGGRRLRIEVRK